MAKKKVACRIIIVHRNIHHMASYKENKNAATIIIAFIYLNYMCR